MRIQATGGAASEHGFTSPCSRLPRWIDLSMGNIRADPAAAFAWKSAGQQRRKRPKLSAKTR